MEIWEVPLHQTWHSSPVSVCETTNMLENRSVQVQLCFEQTLLALSSESSGVFPQMKSNFSSFPPEWSSHVGSFYFICPGFAISADKTPAVTPIQWRWMEFFVVLQVSKNATVTSVKNVCVGARVFVWCRCEGPCRHPEVGGDSSGSAADEGGEAGGRQTAPYPLPPGRLLWAKVSPKPAKRTWRLWNKWLFWYLITESKLEGTIFLSLSHMRLTFSHMWVTTYSTYRKLFNKTRYDGSRIKHKGLHCQKRN